MSLVNDSVATGINVRNLFSVRALWAALILLVTLSAGFLYGEWQFDRATQQGYESGVVRGYDQAMIEILSESSVNGGFSITHDGATISYIVANVDQPEDAQ